MNLLDSFKLNQKEKLKIECDYSFFLKKSKEEKLKEIFSYLDRYPNEKKFKNKFHKDFINKDRFVENVYKWHLAKILLDSSFNKELVFFHIIESFNIIND